MFAPISVIRRARLWIPFILPVALLFSNNSYSKPIVLDTQGDTVALSLDNDLFVPMSTDQDYTAGFAITYSGAGAIEHWNTPDRLLESLDTTIVSGPTDGYHYVPSIEFGGYGFTPADLSVNTRLEYDRPYASLVYLAAGRTYYSLDTRHAWTTSFAFGFLGLDLFKAAQNTVHHLIGSETARGWRHQISEGGEPAFRYQQAYHQYWGRHDLAAQYKTSYFGSIGYITEAGLALATRRGTISSPDYRFNPELITYGERTSELIPPSSGDRESYFWAGAAIKLRLYNAFLQGQFRHSAHTLSHDQLRPLIVDAWLGYTRSFGHDIQISYVVRGNSSEIKDGTGDRTMLWGAFVLSHKI